MFYEYTFFVVEKSNKHNRTASVLRAGILGLGLSIPVTEVYLHAGKAHRTVKTKGVFDFMCWVASRATGIDPTSFAIDHRDHHADRSEEPKTLPEAIFTSVKKGLVGRKSAEKILASPGIEDSMLFAGMPVDEDPVIKVSDSGLLEPKYQNKIDKLISKNKLTRVAAFAGFVGMHYSVSKLHNKDAKVADSILFAGIVSIATYAPAFLGGALPEAIEGYESGSSAGRNSSFSAFTEIGLGNHAYHANHHDEPSLFEPPGVKLGRDAKVVAILESIGAVEVIDHSRTSV